MDCGAPGCDTVHCVVCGASTDGSGLCDDHQYDHQEDTP